MLSNLPPPPLLPSLCVTEFNQVICQNMEGAIFSGGRAAYPWTYHWRNDSLFLGSHYPPLAPQGGLEPPEYHTHLWWVLKGLILYRSLQVAQHFCCMFIQEPHHVKKAAFLPLLSWKFCRYWMERCRFPVQDEKFLDSLLFLHQNGSMDPWFSLLIFYFSSVWLKIDLFSNKISWLWFPTFTLSYGSSPSFKSTDTWNKEPSKLS